MIFLFFERNKEVYTCVQPLIHLNKMVWVKEIIGVLYTLCLFAQMLLFLVLDLSFRCTVSRRRKKSVIICYNER